MTDPRIFLTSGSRGPIAVLDLHIYSSDKHESGGLPDVIQVLTYDARDPSQGDPQPAPRDPAGSDSPSSGSANPSGMGARDRGPGGKPLGGPVAAGDGAPLPADPALGATTAISADPFRQCPRGGLT